MPFLAHSIFPLLDLLRKRYLNEHFSTRKSYSKYYFGNMPIHFIVSLLNQRIYCHVPQHMQYIQPFLYKVFPTYSLKKVVQLQ